MTITLDPQTEARLRAIAESKHLPVEACLAQMVERDAEGLTPSEETSPPATLVRDGPFLAISTPLPAGWNPLQAIDEMRTERDHQVLGP